MGNRANRSARVSSEIASPTSIRQMSTVLYVLPRRRRGTQSMRVSSASINTTSKVSRFLGNTVAKCTRSIKTSSQSHDLGLMRLRKTSPLFLQTVVIRFRRTIGLTILSRSRVRAESSLRVLSRKAPREACWISISSPSSAIASIRKPRTLTSVFEASHA